MPHTSIREPYVRLRIDKPGSAATVTRGDIIQAVMREYSSGQLPPGSRLPPVRVLHHQFGLSKNTAHAAYEELVARGVVKNHKRRGYFVQRQPARRQQTSIVQPAPLLVPDCPAVASRPRARRDLIELSSVFIARELLPLPRISECIRRVLKKPGLQYMYDAQGYEPLRRLIAQRLDRRGIPAQARDIVVTTGSQQALDIVGRALRARCIATEDPTYGIGKQLFELQHMQVIGLPLNPFTGADLDGWRHRIEASKPGAFYLTTNFQNPTGYSYSTAELMALLRLSREYRFGLIEDDWGSDMLSYSEFRPPLRAFGGEEVLYINSFTKKLLPSLRLGYLLCNSRILPSLLAVKRVCTLASSTLIEAALCEFLERGYFDAHLRAMQPQLDAWYQSCLARLQALMPEGVRWTTPGGGPNIWLEVPRRVDLQRLADRVALRGAAIQTLRDWFFGTPHLHGIRLGYAQHPPERFSVGLEILADEIRRALR